MEGKGGGEDKGVCMVWKDNEKVVNILFRNIVCILIILYNRLSIR